jgi:hypothetical protein
MMKISSTQMAMMGALKGNNIIIHAHYDGFRFGNSPFTILSYCYAIPGFSNFVFTVALYNQKEEETKGPIVDFVKNMQKIDNTNIAINTLSKNTLVNFKTSVIFCVDLKAERLAFEYQEILLILICEGKERWLNAVPLQSLKNHQAYTNLTDHPDFQDLIEKSEKAPYALTKENFETKEVKYCVVRCNQKIFGLNNNIAFRSCPLNCYTPKGTFEDRWYYDVPLIMPDESGILTFLKRVQKSNQVLGKSLLALFKKAKKKDEKEKNLGYSELWKKLQEEAKKYKHHHVSF